MTEPTDAVVEAIARYLCLSMGYEPEAAGDGGKRAWEEWAAGARRAIELHRAVTALDTQDRIARLQLAPGDVLVVKSAITPSRHQTLRAILPAGVRVLYVPPDTEISVLTAAEIEGRAR